MPQRSGSFQVPYPRTRYVAGIVRPVASVGNTLVTFGTQPGTFNTVPGAARALGNEGESRICLDTVTPGYARIVSRGGIVNNPFTSVRCTCTHGGTGQFVQFTGPTNPWPVGNFTNDVAATLRTYDSRYLLGDVIPSDGNFDPLSFLSEVDVHRLVTMAKTSALSKVDQNLAAGLVGLGELRATLTSLVNPLSSIRSYIKRSRWGKLAQRGVIKDPTLALANEYLAFYYGLLPFCRDIESYIDAYVKSGYQPERITARGGANDSHASSTAVPMGNPVAGVSAYSHLFTHDVEVEVRSGILYQPTPLTWQKVYGVRFSDFLDAAYQLTPWSFFVDYFSNLGRLINALAPRQGVTYLASWSTIIGTVTDRAQCTGSGIGGTWAHTRINTEWAERVIKVRVRNPEPTYANLGLAFKTGSWASKTKVVALISLITQQLLK